jgi:hypothetical protein
VSFNPIRLRLFPVELVYTSCPEGRLKSRRETIPDTRRTTVSINLETDRRSTHNNVNAVGEQPNTQLQEGVNIGVFKEKQNGTKWGISR